LANYATYYNRVPTHLALDKDAPLHRPAQTVGLIAPSGESRAAAVAQRLGMSTRSVARRLAEEGTSFGEILEQLQQRLASRYLGDDSMSIQQIAWLLGYSEPGAFTHAYRRWTGTTPRRARKPPPASS
jgi:AraC-like DNA-binding protein